MVELAIWGHLDAAQEDIPLGHQQLQLGALRAEMAGRVLMCRLELGWLAKTPSAPEVMPSLKDLGLDSNLAPGA